MKNSRLYVWLILFAAATGCAAKSEPRLIAPRVFDAEETYELIITIYPDEPAGQLRPAGVVLYEGWSRVPITGEFRKIENEGKPAWKITLSTASDSPESADILINSSASPAAMQKLSAKSKVHFAGRLIYVVAEYRGKVFTIKLPLHKRKVTIHSASHPTYRWTSGRETISE